MLSLLYDLVVEGNLVTVSGLSNYQIGINNDVIDKISKQGLTGEKTLNVNDSLVFPGFIDIHTHLREPGWEYKEDITSGTKAAIHGGVTSLVDMPNSPESAVNLTNIQNKIDLISKKSLIDVFIYAGVTSDNVDILSDFSEYVVGYKIYTCHSTGKLYLPYNFLENVAKIVNKTGKPISVHCEDQLINEKNMDDLKNVDNPQIHCDSRPDYSEVKAVKEVIELPGRINICHVSTPETVNIVNTSQSSDVTCEVTLHHLFFNNSEIENSLLKVNPPIRGKVFQAKLLDQYSKGFIDFLVTDHAPHLLSEKKVGIWDAPSGVAGLDDFGKVVSWLIVEKHVDPVVVLKTACVNPSKFLNLSDRGEIKVGLKANLTVLDLKKSCTTTSESLYTKCGWSPYEGVSFPGCVQNTIVDGKIMSEYDTVF